MDVPAIVVHVSTALVSAAFAAGGAYAAVRSEIQGLRRDVDRHDRLLMARILHEHHDTD